ncbi:MAG: hypothetical protein M1812_000387 [Candelaria pacifica]|nr:MAG: hypothetical protein M1812_000387 [Candelaria pacifica]
MLIQVDILLDLTAAINAAVENQTYFSAHHSHTRISTVVCKSILRFTTTAKNPSINDKPHPENGSQSEKVTVIAEQHSNNLKLVEKQDSLKKQTQKRSVQISLNNQFFQHLKWAQHHITPKINNESTKATAATAGVNTGSLSGKEAERPASKDDNRPDEKQSAKVTATPEGSKGT